jgi:copper chaperone NosL
MKGFNFVVALMVLVFLAGCSDDKANRLDPPEIDYGSDISEMGMFVTDPRYTVAVLPADSDWLLFDDTGEFLRYVQINPEIDFDVMWVPDFNDKTWIRAEDAWYLESREFRASPMGWGIATFRDEASARAAHEQHGGTIMTWDEAMQKPWQAPPAPGA